ncbi:MAG: hypothetical protein JSS77_14780 [Acidobacteria bacterium]|nr:hypothetical protein [Acidobacteriota bacterium]
MRKNLFAGVALLALILAVIGCGRLNPLSRRESPATDKEAPSASKPETGREPSSGAPESTGETSGIPECDEAIDIINRETNRPDDNFISRAAKTTILNRVKDEIKKAVNDSKAHGNSNTEDLVKTCREFRDQLEKSLADEKTKGK